MIDELSNFLSKLNSNNNHIPFSDPRKLNFNNQFIDKKIKFFLSTINKSDYCWTLFSCQGHNHKDGSKSLPYFVFIVKNEFLGQFFRLIYDTIPKSENTNFPLLGYSYNVSVGFSDEKFSIISIHWSMQFLESRGILNTLHQKLDVMGSTISDAKHEQLRCSASN